MVKMDKKKRKKGGLSTKAKKKEATARAKVVKGTGIMRINKRNVLTLSPEFIREFVMEPVEIAGDSAKEVDIDVTVNETLDAGTAVIPSADPGKITINVRFIRRSSKEILYSQEKDQDPTEVNPEFKLPFRSDPPNPTEVSSVSVKFGNYGTDGMLMISTSSLEGEITRFEIYYDNSDSRTIIDTGANLKINDKSSDIILAQQ